MFKRIKIWAKALYLKFRKEPAEKNQSNEVYQKIASMPHSCAMMAIHQFFPEKSFQDLEDAFSLCTKNEWPQRGIFNNEFNIILDYLDLKEEFEYQGHEEKISTLLKRKYNCIALVPRHYTVIKNGELKDQYQGNINVNQQAYCYWRKIKY